MATRRWAGLIARQPKGCQIDYQTAWLTPDELFLPYLLSLLSLVTLPLSLGSRFRCGEINALFHLFGPKLKPCPNFPSSSGRVPIGILGARQKRSGRRFRPADATSTDTLSVSALCSRVDALRDVKPCFRYHTSPRIVSRSKSTLAAEVNEGNARTFALRAFPDSCFWEPLSRTIRNLRRESARKEYG